ncbi:MAG: hypothetical protein II590_05330, partial [Clostridia bacterium]|nr:hypothetical protein [Clostridia bacterium]
CSKSQCDRFMPSCETYPREYSKKALAMAKNQCKELFALQSGYLGMAYKYCLMTVRHILPTALPQAGARPSDPAEFIYFFAIIH